MKATEIITREEMWARQQMAAGDVDYAVWERRREALRQWAGVSGGCTFVVDVYKGRYAYASGGFVDLLGYERRKIETLERQGDYLESRIHPDDRQQLEALQVQLARFIYSLPEGERNDFSNIYSFRVRDARQRYVRVVSRQRVLEQDRRGKAWLVLGHMDIDACQRERERVECTVLNLKSGEMFPAAALHRPVPVLTGRETEILRLIGRGLLSKEIADRLGISIHTVNIHRQNLLHKLGVQNAVEAINAGSELGLLR